MTLTELMKSKYTARADRKNLKDELDCAILVLLISEHIFRISSPGTSDPESLCAYFESYSMTTPNFALELSAIAAFTNAVVIRSRSP